MFVKTFKSPAAEYHDLRTVEDNGKVTITQAPTITDPISDNDWPDYVGAIRLAESEAPKSLKDMAKDFTLAAVGSALQMMSPWEPSVWETGTNNGRILFADEKEMTYRFKGGATERYRNVKNRVLAADESEIKGILGSIK